GRPFDLDQPQDRRLPRCRRQTPQRKGLRILSVNDHLLRPPRSLGGFAHTIPRHAVTRLEILVAVALCVFAAGFGAMVIVRHRENANRAQCTNNLRVIGLAFYAYYDASSADQGQKRFPPSRVAAGYATWPVLLAPYLLKDQPLHQWDLPASYFSQNDDACETRLLMYFCPSRQRTDTLSQAGDVDAAHKHFPGALGDYAAVAGDGSAEHDWTGPQANGALVIADVLERKDDRILKW